MEDNSAYIILEILIATFLLGIIVSLLAMINISVVDFWEMNTKVAAIQREAVLSLEMIVNIIDRSVAVDQIKKTELMVLTSTGEWEKIYYKTGQGLCWKADNNLISENVVNLEFNKTTNSLLVIEIVVKKGAQLKKLKTGIEI